MLAQYWQREWHLLLRNKNMLWQPLLFFVLIVCVFPMGMAPTPAVLQKIGAGVIWMAVLLSILMSLPNMLVADLLDGSVEQWLLAEQSLALRLVCKLACWWSIYTVPLLLVTPLLALCYHFSRAQIAVLLLTELVATPMLWWLGGLVATLTATLRQASVILVLLLLPLYVPVLIFATGAVNAVAAGQSVLGVIALLAALSLALFIIVPLLMSVLLRLAVRWG